MSQPNRYTDENGVTYVATPREKNKQGELFDNEPFALSFVWVAVK